MKYFVIIFTCLVYGLLSNGWAQNKDKNPSFEFLNVETGKKITEKDVDNTRAKVFLYYDPRCVHCKTTALTITDVQDSLKNVDFFWVTRPETEKDSILKFKNDHFGNSKLNCYFLQDSKEKSFDSFFGTSYQLTSARLYDNIGLFAGHLEGNDANGLNLIRRLKPILAIKNIEFEFNKAEINETTKSELDKLADYLKMAPKTKIQISSHTDNKGSDEANQKVSDKRSKTVLDYLVSKGAPKNQIVTQSLGKTKPIADNETEEGRQKNRRVEFKILEF